MEDYGSTHYAFRERKPYLLRSTHIMKNCQVLICLEKYFYNAINPIVSDPEIDGVAINFFVFVGWMSTMTLLRVNLRVASTESFGDFKGFPVLNGIFKTLLDHTACISKNLLTKLKAGK